MPAIFNATPIGRIDTNFQTQLDVLKTTDGSIYNSTAGTGQRKWQMPDPNEAATTPWDYNVFNITGISDAYDRTTPNALYIRALTRGPAVGADAEELAIPAGEGRVSDCQVEKIQIDYLASQERAFRLRHSSSVRCSMHAAIRRKGHSDLSDQGMAQVVSSGNIQQQIGPIGGVFTTMIRYLLLLIEGGYNEGAIDINNNNTPTIVYANDGTASAVIV